MADLLMELEGKPTTPAAGQGIFFFDSTAKIRAFLNDTGRVEAYSNNAAIANQTVNAADTYLTNSDLLIPSWGLQAKGTFLFQISASKTGAGTAAPIYSVRIGTNRTTADTARLTLTGPAQTAIADIGTLNILITVRAAGGSCILQGTAFWSHRGTAANTTTSGTGFANDSTGHVEGTSASFDASAVNGQYIGLSVNSGTAGVWTVTQVIAEANW